jgi:hypothetical protein
MGRREFVEPLAQSELLTEIERTIDIGETHRLEEKFAA